MAVPGGSGDIGVLDVLEVLTMGYDLAMKEWIEELRSSWCLSGRDITQKVG